MNDVKLITSNQEKTLSDAIVRSIELVNGGMSPDAALAKSACDSGLSPEFACRMVEAYNASKTVSHIQKTAGTARGDDIELADRNNVISLMYIGEKQPKQQSKVASVLPLFDKISEPALTKAASDNSDKPVLSNIRENNVTRLNSYVQELEKLGSDLRIAYEKAKFDIVKCANELHDLMRTPGHERFDELEKRVVCTYGTLGKRAMDILWCMADFEYLGEKRAAEETDRIYIMGVAPEYEATRSLVSAIEKAASVFVELDEFNKARESVNTKIHGAVKQADKKEKGLLPDPMDTLTKFVGGEQTAAPEPAPAIDPSHEAKLRSIQTRLLVNDMIANDPVLSAYPAEHIFNAYNNVSRMAPGVANEPLLARSLIARVLQTGGRMEPNEVQQLLNAEQTHRQIRAKGI